MRGSVDLRTVFLKFKAGTCRSELIFAALRRLVLFSPSRLMLKPMAAIHINASQELRPISLV